MTQLPVVRLAAVVPLILAMLAGSGRTQPTIPAATPGTTAETAIVLPGIVDEFHGVAAEHAYIAAHFPTWHIEYQTRVAQNDHNYDLLGMIEPDRTKVTLYFDITPWVGK